jgi:hypothetical protein
MSPDFFVTYLSGRSLLNLRHPCCQAVLNLLKPFGRYVADSAKKNPAFNNRKTTHADHTGNLQSALSEVAVMFLDDLIKLRNIVACLRGNHTDQPVVIVPW